MTSNDFAANLYDIEVPFVSEAYGIGSIVMYAYYKVKSMIDLANFVLHIGLDLSISSESDTVTKRIGQLVRAYMRVIYTTPYMRHTCMSCHRTFYFEYFARISVYAYFITFRYGYFVMFTS